ncbi:sugar transferase [Candidatus Pseudothioglobus singularis]|jgi:O-antigen biosynthesis protein WbqP|nr:sugar transferase [Candidatus Pseudothioglobus singularis]
MKRLFDLILAIVLFVALLVPMLFIIIAIRMTSIGPALYWSDRVGLGGSIYKMPKFRSMKLESPQVATHLMSNPDEFLSPIGGFLRRTSLDEIPQLFSIIKGDMSFVGPRPALFNQNDLIALRLENGLDSVLPGLTGWAQVNGRDDLSIPEKVMFEVEYMQKKSFWLDLKILWMTFLKVINKKGVSH